MLVKDEVLLLPELFEICRFLFFSIDVPTQFEVELERFFFRNGALKIVIESVEGMSGLLEE